MDRSTCADLRGPALAGSIVAFAACIACASDAQLGEPNGGTGGGGAGAAVSVTAGASSGSPMAAAGQMATAGQMAAAGQLSSSGTSAEVGNSSVGGASGGGLAAEGGTTAGGAAASLGGSASGSTTAFTIAYSADGNQHDHDDFHASPMSIALIAQAKLKPALTHFDYNNHLGDNDASMASTHAQNVLGAVQAYGLDSSVFFDDQVNVDAAVESLAKAIDGATSVRRLYLVCAGPMEVCWRGINASRMASRANTTAISHSAWNDDHADTPELKHKWSDIVASGVVVQHINDQNTPAFKSSCSDWSWLKSAPTPGAALYDWVCSTDPAGDASDAGMVFYVLSGVSPGPTASSNPNMAAVKAFFGQ